MKIKKVLCRLAIFISILFNLYTLFELSSFPDYKVGTLKNDIEVARFGDASQLLFKLPKGLGVRDASPRGLATIGLFHNNYITFRIEVDDDGSMVDYSPSQTFPTLHKTPIDAEYTIHKRPIK
jgi:hypothetical protein